VGHTKEEAKHDDMNEIHNIIEQWDDEFRSEQARSNMQVVKEENKREEIKEEVKEEVKESSGVPSENEEMKESLDLVEPIEEKKESRSPNRNEAIDIEATEAR